MGRPPACVLRICFGFLHPCSQVLWCRCCLKQAHCVALLSATAVLVYCCTGDASHSIDCCTMGHPHGFHMQVTRKCGGEIAQLQARLMEKEAQLIGGFGNPIKLANARWANTPPYTPQWGTSTNGGGAPGALGKYPFGFEEMKRLASNTQPPSETASSMHSDSKLGRCAPLLEGVALLQTLYIAWLLLAQLRSVVAPHTMLVLRAQKITPWLSVYQAVC